MESTGIHKIDQYVINIQDGICPLCGKRNSKLHLHMFQYILGADRSVNKTIPICGCHRCIVQILSIGNVINDTIGSECLKDKEIEILKLKLEISNLNLKYK